MQRIGEPQTKLITLIGEIENQNTDLIVNWVYSDMRSGPAPFYKLHEKAGPQLRNHVTTYETSLPLMEADCFTTQSAMLPCKLVLHSILSQDRAYLIRSYRNIVETIAVYKRDNVCRTLALYVPGSHNDHLKLITAMLLDLGLKEIRIVCSSESELSEVNSWIQRHPQQVNSFNMFLDDVLDRAGRMGKYFGKSPRKRDLRSQGPNLASSPTLNDKSTGS